MSYRCQICQKPAASGQPRLTVTAVRIIPEKVRYIGPRHVGIPPIVDKTPGRTEVAKELAVCRSCHSRWRRGVSVDEMIREVVDASRSEEETTIDAVEDVFDVGEPPDVNGEIKFGEH